MFEFLSGSELAAFGSVIIIDIVMSGDNAVIIGMAAAGLPPDLRRRAIVYGIIAATVLRIVFAMVTVQLLAILGLTLAGGLLLAWVCWHMWRDIRGGQMQAPESDDDSNPGAVVKTLRQAMVTIIIADVTMSFDNVLAVAGAAQEHLWVLIFGLMLSIALMAVAANYIAQMLERHHWIAYVGLAIIAYVAGDMIYWGFVEVALAAA
ncbi:MAG: TerC family protein [Pseudomonadota bacterium]|nr:TerC family protein [Pseudomonadota bacterium]